MLQRCWNQPHPLRGSQDLFPPSMAFPRRTGLSRFSTHKMLRALSFVQRSARAGQVQTWKTQHGILWDRGHHHCDAFTDSSFYLNALINGINQWNYLWLNTQFYWTEQLHGRYVVCILYWWSAKMSLMNTVAFISHSPVTQKVCKGSVKLNRFL